MVDSIYIGLMTGTSADSLDCAAVNFSKKEMNIIGLKNYDIPNALKQKIQESSQALELNESLIKDLDIKLGNFFSESIKDLIKTLSLDKNQVSGIGSHGQTIKHEPNAENPYSMQIGDPQLISNNLGIKTVGRFRDDDILAGGQGAPISPVFHREVFAQTGEKRLIVNIGGITNISVISDQEIMGFDTGPGNCLMDTWCRKNLKGDFDDEGNWAKSGEVNKTLLDFMIDDNYFKKEHPKSTGPDYFNEGWLCSIRIHDKNIQSLMFKHLGFSEKQAKEQFGFLMNAFEYGAPPHGGIALGLDRLVAILDGNESIKDYIAFPKNNSGKDIMIDAPSPISKEQLDELSLSLKSK